MIKEISDPFQVIADPCRRHILQLLSRDSLTINNLAENFVISRPAVSKHIKILCQGGFISIQDIGRERYCILNREGFNKINEWINYFDKFWVTKLNKLETIISNKAKN